MSLPLAPTTLAALAATLALVSPAQASCGDLRVVFEAEVVSASGGGLTSGPLAGLAVGAPLEVAYEVQYPFALDPFGSTVYAVDYGAASRLQAGGQDLLLAPSADPRSQAVTFNPLENSIYAESACATYLLRVSVWDPAGPPITPTFDLVSLAGSSVDFAGTLQPILFLEESAQDRLVGRVDRMRVEPASLGTRSCSPAVPNSRGTAGLLLIEGTPSPTSTNLRLRALGLPPGELVLFLVSSPTAYLPGAGGSAGTLCLGSPLGRFNAPGQLAPAGPSGIANLPLDPTHLPLGGGLAVTAGETWHFQAWYRDSAPLPTSNLTDAVSLLFP